MTPDEKVCSCKFQRMIVAEHMIHKDANELLGVNATDIYRRVSLKHAGNMRVHLLSDSRVIDINRSIII